LLQAGLVATINSDDPAYFGGYMNDNFLACFGELPLRREHARQLSANAFEASFASAEQKARYADRLAEYEATH
ncbi:MAG: adenosine deaminase, partial [Xanthomonadales bacterium]|nr:adenosine deaminase [Xanthomonadales bacterium]